MNAGVLILSAGVERKVSYVLYSLRGDRMAEPKKASSRKLAYDKQYYDDHITRKVLNFNNLIPEDAELLEWLESLGKREMSSYIKRLVRADMEKQKRSGPA
jgi:hypothetical protein